MILQIVSVEKYPSTKSISSFFGLHPIYIESGDHVGESRMSKQGASEMRRLLYLATQTAVRDDPRLKKLYEHYIEAKSSRMSALGIMMHKMLRIIYGMLKHKKEYDSKIDEENTKRTEKRKITSKRKQAIVDKNRRFQAHDENAPISRRQSKKRNQLKEAAKEEQGKIEEIGGNNKQ